MNWMGPGGRVRLVGSNFHSDNVTFTPWASDLGSLNHEKRSASSNRPTMTKSARTLFSIGVDHSLSEHFEFVPDGTAYLLAMARKRSRQRELQT